MTSRSKEFLDRLHSDYVFVADGAMGTMLYAKGVFINRCFDELNISSPELVKEVHREYLRAGAEIIETNTFAANRFKLAAHGYVDKLREINIAGARIAKEEAGDSAFIAGSIGPLGKAMVSVARKDPEGAREAFREQIEALVEGGVDLLFFETMSSMADTRVGVEVAREICDLPVMATITFHDNKKTIFGGTPEEAVKTLSEAGADIVGANCGIGPKVMLEVLEKMALTGKSRLAGLPNAGAPQMIDGRYLYLTSPEYLAEYAKRFIQGACVQVVGGCCGTTPDHIKAMRSAVRALQPGKKAIVVRPVAEEKETFSMQPVDIMEKSAFARKLRRKFTTSVELYPPRGTNPAKVLQSAMTLKEYGVDCVNIPDGPRAMARMSPMALAHMIEDEVGIETILHYCCRDRNILGMQSDILGCHALNIKNILAITGDPPKLGDYPDATSVFDIDSIGLVQMLHHLNCGEDLVGNSIGTQSAFHLGVGANPGALNFEHEIERYKQKVDAGAEFVMTQPIFDIELLERFLAATKEHRIPIMVGVLPLVSSRNAEFLHNEVPGMTIPQEIRDRVAKAPQGKEKEEGIAIAKEAVKIARNMEGVRGIYVMPPFGRYRMALKVLDLL